MVGPAHTDNERIGHFLSVVQIEGTGIDYVPLALSLPMLTGEIVVLAYFTSIRYAEWDESEIEDIPDTLV